LKIDDITKDIIIQAQRGNRDAFEKLYKSFYKEVFSIARYALGNDTKAEDVLQETFLKVYYKLPELNAPEAFSSWLYRITQNECRMAMRKRDEKLLFFDTQSEDFSKIVDIEPEVPEFDFETAEDRHLVRKEVENLPVQYRTVIVYFYYLNLSVKEIADLLSCRESTVKSRLFTGRAMLKKSLLLAQEKLGYQLALSLIPMSRLLDAGLLEHSLPDKAAALLLSSILGKLTVGSTIFGRIWFFLRNFYKRLSRSARNVPPAAAVAALVVALFAAGLLYAEASGAFAERGSAGINAAAQSNTESISSDMGLSQESEATVETAKVTDVLSKPKDGTADSFTTSLFPSPTPVVTPALTLTPAPVVTPDPALSPVPTLTPGPTPSSSPQPEPTYTPTPIPSPLPTVSPSPAVTSTPIPSATPSPIVSPIPTETPTPMPTPAPFYFSDMSGGAETEWMPGTGSGSVSIENNALVVLGSPTYLTYNDYTSSTDAVLVTTMIPGSANCRFGIVFRYVDAANYAMIGYNNGTWFWQNGTGSTGTIESAGPELTKDVPVCIRLSYIGSTISVEVNGTSCFTEDLADLPVAEGKVGFYAMNGGKFTVDDLAIYIT